MFSFEIQIYVCYDRVNFCDLLNEIHNLKKIDIYSGDEYITNVSLVLYFVGESKYIYSKDYSFKFNICKTPYYN